MKLVVINGPGWDTMGYYSIGNKEYINATDPRKKKGWVDALPYLSEIGILENLKELDFSLLGLEALLFGVTALNKLKVLDISFNTLLNWPDILSKLEN